MAISAGEVEATLKLKDEMTAAFAASMATLSTQIEGVRQRFNQVADAAHKSGEAHASASKNTQTLGETVSGLGTKLVALAAAYFSVRAITGFVEMALHDAAALKTMSIATGIATNELQRLNAVGSDFGLQSGEMARAVQMLTERLASKDPSAISAVRALGLSVKDLIAAGPYEALLSIAEAAGSIQDPMMKNSIASDLFTARIAKFLIPMLGDLREKVAEVPKTSIMSPKTIEDSAKFANALSNIKLQAEALVAEGFSKLIDHSGALSAALFFATGRWVEIGRASKEAGKAHDIVLPKMKSDAELLQNELRALLHDGFSPLTAEQQRNARTLDTLGDSHANIAKLINATEGQVRVFIGTIQKQQEAEKKLWEIEKKSIQETEMLWSDYFALRVEHGGTAIDAQKAQIQAWFDNEVNKLDDSDRNWQDHYDALAAVTKEKLQFVGSQWNEISERSIRARQQSADAAVDDYNRMIHSGDFWREDLDKQIAKVRELNDAARGMGQSYIVALMAAKEKAEQLRAEQEKIRVETEKARKAEREKGGAFEYDLSTKEGVEEFRRLNPSANIKWSDDQIVEFVKRGGTLQQLVNMGVIDVYAGFKNRFQSGVKDFTGGAAVVGEHGPELVTLPPHADVIPTDRLGGQTFHNTFYVNGTAEESARKIFDVLMRQLKTVRQFGAA